MRGPGCRLWLLATLWYLEGRNLRPESERCFSHFVHPRKPLKRNEVCIVHPAEVVAFHYGEVMLKDGFHLHIGVNRRVLSIVSKNKGKYLWIRDFVDDSSALAVFEDEVLGQDDLARAYKTVGNGFPFFTQKYKEPKGGFSDCGMSKYERTAP